MENFDDFKETLGDFFNNLKEVITYSGESAEDALPFEAILHSIWFPIIGFILAFIFIIKNQKVVGGTLLICTGLGYMYFHLLPQISLNPSGAGTFLGVLVAGAGAAIYVLLIKGD